jgi:hypothetical protein
VSPTRSFHSDRNGLFWRSRLWCCHVQMVERAGRHNNATCVVPSRLAALPRDRPNVLRDIDGIEVSVAEV